MSPESLTIVWFRQDLRLADNPALSAAVARGRILPIYILDDINPGQWTMGAASRVWLHHSLDDLDRSFDGRLRYFCGDPQQIIDRLVETLPVDAVYWNRCYEPWRIHRDRQIRARLDSLAIECRSFNASLLWEPWTVSKKDGSPYRVFTPFYKKGCLGLPRPRQPLAMPEQLGCFETAPESSLTLAQLGLKSNRGWDENMISRWRCGESEALRKLEEFCRVDLEDYKQARDFPAMDATSKLSPHLHFGEISPHQAWRVIDHATSYVKTDGPAHFARELAWREFSYYLLYHFPDLPDKNFNLRFDRFPWSESSTVLSAWQHGQTGYPIIDAGMRELWQTGYMHNRVRMLVASFLVKNMLLHWRHGAAWFWDCLVDADLASNSASWQWCAGSGADAAPYFRIFNPVLQSEKFDPGGEYLSRYCPELAALPLPWRHKPWQADARVLADAGIRLGLDYPRPILDLKETRQNALAQFKQLA